MGDDFKVVSDKTDGRGVRHISAVPSAVVCSVRIDFDIVEGRIHDLRYERGCNGNLQAIGRLLEGMRVEEAVGKLRGVDCNFRGTSCADQLARILSSLGEAV